MMRDSKNIPKYLHYCWFGKKQMPEIVKKCMESWKTFCVDFEIIRWDESNFDIYANEYVKLAYKNEKFAFVADYVRLWVLFHFGGVYVDTDVELLKNIEGFLSLNAFAGLEGYNRISAGIIGAQKGNLWIKNILDFYNENIDNFIDIKNPSIKQISIVDVITYVSEKLHGFSPGNNYQILSNGVHIFPMEYFYPIAPDRKENFFTDRTYSIHHYTGTWLKKTQTLKIGIKRLLNIEKRKFFWYLQSYKREKLFKNFRLPYNNLNNFIQ